MIEAFAGPMLIVARFLMGALFIVGGLRHFPRLDAITPALAARGVPMPRAVLIFGSAYEIFFGIMLAAGFQVGIAALALVIFTIVASVMLVNFWDMAEPERSAMFGVFLSNVAIVGGLLGLAATG